MLLAEISTQYALLKLLKSLFFQSTFQLNISHDITKTRLYNFDPLKPHFYTVKLGFTGV